MLTREEAQQMPVGRQLDIMIATKVMGWTMHPNGKTTSVDDAREEWCHDFVPPRFGGDLQHAQSVPYFSYSLNQAIEIAEHLRASSLPCYPFILTEDRYGGCYSGGRWLASFGVDMPTYEDGPLGDDIDAMDFWQFKLSGWKNTDGPMGGHFDVCTTDARANIAAASTAPLAICRAALLAHIPTPSLPTPQNS